MPKRFSLLLVLCGLLSGFCFAEDRYYTEEKIRRMIERHEREEEELRKAARRRLDREERGLAEPSKSKEGAKEGDSVGFLCFGVIVVVFVFIYFLSKKADKSIQANN